MAAARNAVQVSGEVKRHRCLRSCRAVGHSAIAECLHSMLKIIAVGILNVLVP